MTFEEILDQAITMLQRRGRLTYGTLKRQFQLDDAALEDLKDELIYGQRLAVALPEASRSTGAGIGKTRIISSAVAHSASNTPLHEPMFTYVVSTRRATLWPPAGPPCQTLR